MKFTKKPSKHPRIGKRIHRQKEENPMGNRDGSKSNYATLQRWLLTAITHPEGTAAGIEQSIGRSGISLGDIVEDGPILTAQERVDIYTGMYFWRLVDILREDLPALEYALGPTRFEEIATACLAKHPPSGYSLQCLGKSLPRFLREEGTRKEDPPAVFLAELAELELKKELSFDAVADEALEEDALTTVPPEDWGNLSFVPLSSLQLFETSYPVGPYSVTQTQGGEAAIPAPTPSYFALNRPEYSVNLVELTGHEYLLLSSLVEGCTLLEGLENLLESTQAPPESLMEELLEWFTKWGANHFFSSIQ
jgi:hypothetical protein